MSRSISTVRWTPASPPSERRRMDRQTRRGCASAGDVLGREPRPGRAEEDQYVDDLYEEASGDVVPEDREAEDVDERQPVVGGEVRLEHGGGVEQVENLGADEHGDRSQPGPDG